MGQYDLETIRHSTAHLMVQAIQRLYPNEKIELGIGPAIENGFYYDILMDKKILDEELKNIEDEMKKIIKEKLPITRRVFANREEAAAFFKERGQNLKVELINDLPAGEEISCYEQGEFIDLCRGPHVEHTGQLPTFFKLTTTAGAYWRGDSSRPMLQRIYAISFDSKEALKAHLTFLEEAKKRDHRKLGKDLDLFFFSSEAPASPFFLPKGAFVYNELMDFMRRVIRYHGYLEVVTPQMLDVSLWKTSGHYDNYHEDMFFSESENRQFALKPMNCPTHMLVFQNKRVSYRELPMRIADFGRIHRNERSGTITGLTRVRTFCQDDGHIFLSMDQVQNEIQELMKIVAMTYRHLGFEDFSLALSTRPEKKLGDDATWDQAENALKDALEKSGVKYTIAEGDGAFYGPKIDITVRDAIGRRHQLATIQLDFQLPERFDLTYMSKEGKEERPIVIHRAILGSLERFFGVYLENIAGAFPFWIAPEQAVIIPVNTEKFADYCDSLYAKFKQKGYRVRIDDRNESLGKKTRESQMAKIPFMLVIGEKEVEAGTVSVRKYGEMQSQTMSLDELCAAFDKLNEERNPIEMRYFWIVRKIFYCFQGEAQPNMKSPLSLQATSKNALTKKPFPSSLLSLRKMANGIWKKIKKKFF